MKKLLLSLSAALLMAFFVMPQSAHPIFADDGNETEPAVLEETGTGNAPSPIPLDEAETESDPFLIPWAGSGTEGEPYLLSTSDDWEALSEYVNAGNSTEGMYFLMDNDIDITTMIGTGPDDDEKPFKGVFDGGGHTLGVSIDVDSDMYMTAPFCKICDATIRHLKVTGSVKGGRHCSGLVGRASGTNTIIDCDISADITTTDYCGGIIGHGTNSNTTIEGCVFRGSVTGNNATVGAIWGWSGSAAVTIKNCLEAGTYSGVRLNPVGCGWTNGKQVINMYYSNSSSGSPSAAWGSEGKMKCVISADEGITIDPGEYTEYETSGIRGYDTGIGFDGALYAGNDEILSVTLPELPSGMAYGISSGGIIGSGTNYRIYVYTEGDDINVFLITDFATVTIDPGGDDSILRNKSFTVPKGTEMEEVFYLICKCFNNDKYGVGFENTPLGPWLVGYTDQYYYPAFYIGFKKSYSDMSTYTEAIEALSDKTADKDMTAYVLWNKPVKDVTIGVHTPRPGDAIGENPPEIEIESDGCFEFYYKEGDKVFTDNYWMDENYNRIKDGVFEEGKTYYAITLLMSEFGYYFPIDFENHKFDFDVTVRGGTLVDYDYEILIYLAVEVTAGNEDALTYDITKTKVGLSKSEFAYNGKVQKPTIKTINGQKLKEGTDYTVKWSNASSTNTGLYKVTVTGKGKYHGKTTAIYRICYSDVPLSHSYSGAVYWASDSGIAAGYTGANAGKFGVADDITRGQVMMFLWRAAGKPEPAGTGKDFSDVPSSNNFYTAIKWGVEQGITGGYTGARKGEFGPNDNCTRGQIATFLWRYAGSPAPKSTEPSFTDVDPKSGFFKAIQWASEEGITAGFKDGTFGVNKTCTRGQCVTFLYRLLG